MMPVIEQLLHLNVLPGAALLMSLMTIVGLAVYFVSSAMFARSRSKETHRTANYLFRAIGILVSLFLSLTFADIMLEMNQIEASIEREAVMIEDIYRDLSRYDSSRSRRTQALVVDYFQAVIAYDWPALANDKLSAEARGIFGQMEYEVLHLEDNTELQGILRSRII